MALILQEYTVKNPIFVFLTFLTDFSDHLLSASKKFPHLAVQHM